MEQWGREGGALRHRLATRAPTGPCRPSDVRLPWMFSTPSLPGWPSSSASWHVHPSPSNLTCHYSPACLPDLSGPGPHQHSRVDTELLALAASASASAYVSKPACGEFDAPPTWISSGPTPASPTAALGSASGDFHDGTTALVTLQLGGLMTVANAGDSRAVLCRRGEVGGAVGGRLIAALITVDPASQALFDGVNILIKTKLSLLLKEGIQNAGVHTRPQ